MASDMLQIGKSGTIAARSALELTAQNIANANNEDYSRRSLSLADVTGTGSVAFYSSSALSGVRVDQVMRSDSLFLQSQARRTSGDLAQADAELSGVKNAEAAIEQAGIFPALVEFEASLAALDADPLSPALRAAALEQGRNATETLNIADASLQLASEQIRFEANANVDQVNLAVEELARLNASIIRSEPGTTGQLTLLDQRDAQLRDIANLAGITVEYQPSGAVNVRLGNSSGPYVVSGTQTATLSATNIPDGTLAFALDGAAVTIDSGALAGQSSALIAQRDARTELDSVAALLIQRVNDAQANGTAPDGTAGQPFFGGSTAADIAVVLSGGGGIATAPAGASAGSRDTGNLAALRDSLANDGPSSEIDRVLYQLANTARSRSITREALSTIAESAQASLARETAVDLDAEAANLVRYQQAFQASGRVIQVAADLFDTILGLR